MQRIGLDHSKCRDLNGSFYDPSNIISKNTKWDRFDLQPDLNDADLLVILGD